jgi:hypothetical protein
MAVPYTFGTVVGGTSIPLSQLDSNFDYLATNGTFTGTTSFQNITVSGTASISGLATFVTSNIGTATGTSLTTTGLIKSSSSSAGIGYATGAGSAVTQGTSRTTGVTINAIAGAITLVSAAGSTSYQSFTVTNSSVAATDVIIVNQKSGTDLYEVFVTAVAAGSFKITFATTSGTTTEQPVFNFAIIKSVAA